MAAIISTDKKTIKITFDSFKWDESILEEADYAITNGGRDTSLRAQSVIQKEADYAIVSVWNNIENKLN